MNKNLKKLSLIELKFKKKRVGNRGGGRGCYKREFIPRESFFGLDFDVDNDVDDDDVARQTDGFDRLMAVLRWRPRKDA